jgi:regulator of cell morphogenesis and NO signaling
MVAIKSRTVAELVSENYKTADVFKKYGIDFCCGGGSLLAEICERKNIDFSEVESDLLSLDSKTDRAHDYDHWELDFLIDYIVQTHHSYIRENIPVLIQYSEKLAKVHGHHYTEVMEIDQLLHGVLQELDMHMKKEEHILFPFIKELAIARREGREIPTPPFGTIQNPIAMMESEHDNAGDAFHRIAELTNQYTPPPTACNTHRVLYAKIEEFEDDLHMHIHLENNILFPKAIKIEQSV